MSALDQISWVVTGYAVLVALLAGWSAYRWRRRPPWLDSMAWMLEALLGLRAVAGLGSLLPGIIESPTELQRSLVCPRHSMLLATAVNSSKGASKQG